MSDPNELKRTLMFARDLADPDWSLSVPKPAKDTIRKLLAIIEAAKPRIITTAEELDALGFESVVLDPCGTPAVCIASGPDGSKWTFGLSGVLDSETLLLSGTHCTVLYEPVEP